MAHRRFSYADHCPEHLIQWVDGFPVPPSPKRRPLHALISVMKLVRNKEDTRQVFETIHALSDTSGRDMFERFVGTTYGRRVVTEPVRIERILSDRDWLRSLPDGSLGRAYLGFMESEGLTAEGVISAAEEAGVDYQCETQFEAFRRLMMHMEVVHDVWHVLNGYGRDALGEICVLAFSHALTGNAGVKLIVNVGMLAAKAEAPDLPIFKAVAEAGRRGRAAAWLIGEDIAALAPEPLEDVRRKLNLTPATAYQSIPAARRQALLKPRETSTQTDREQARTAAAH